MNIPEGISERLAAQGVRPRFTEAIESPVSAASLPAAIAVVRESVAAILRLRLDRPQRVKKGRTVPARYNVNLAGSAFCVVADKYLVTAHHVLNGGQSRDPGDKFYAFIVPGNGDKAYHFPIASFPLERPELDIAVLEVGPCANEAVHIPSLPVCFSEQDDGNPVVTVGFPAPVIVRVNLDQEGNYAGGEFFLKSHANEGIVSAQYALNDVKLYELNVAWQHGESGGPRAPLTDPPAAFSLMQSYRQIKAPHGVMAGPRRGCALSAVQKELTELGVIAAANGG